MNAIRRLKREKGHGSDCFLNEFFIEFKGFILPFLCTMFNAVLDSGYFPSSWTDATLVPVFKSGDVNDPGNYRGISLVSNLGKLFTSILNLRLLTWASSNNVLTDAQFGFRNGYSTVDAIFCVYSVIQNILCKGKRLYCCFVDYKKAFDSIDRMCLWYKLAKIGIRGKLLSVLKSMYENVRTCIRFNGVNSEYFSNNLGVMQGEVLSPILFSFYVNDFELEFISKVIVLLNFKT